MTIVAEGRQNVRRVLGKQKRKNTDYRLMRYVIDSEVDSGVLLYNVITGQLILLDSEEQQYLKSLPIPYSTEMSRLIEDYYLVPLEFDERTLVIDLRKVLHKLFSPEGINSYTILTTTNCNARCFYCYQDGYQHITMSSEVADQLIRYIKEHKRQSAVRLHWFGGEPLLGVSRIDQICEALRTSNVSYTSSMITNGYLITEDIVKKALALWNLKKVQITLDGTEQIYNATKNYIGVSGNPYIRVVENIKILIRHHIEVSIRMNLDQHNMENLKLLADDLLISVGCSKYLSAYVRVLFEGEGASPINRDSSLTKRLYEKQVELNKYLGTIGLAKDSISLPSIETHHCMADGDNSVVVFPDGKLYKCEHTKMGDDFSHIFGSQVSEPNLQKFKDTVETRSCAKCPLFPKCILLKVCNGKNIVHQQEVCKYEIDSVKQSVTRYWNRISELSVSPK